MQSSGFLSKGKGEYQGSYISEILRTTVLLGTQKTSRTTNACRNSKQHNLTGTIAPDLIRGADEGKPGAP